MANAASRPLSGSTEGFGSYFVAPQRGGFQGIYPNIAIDLLPVAHFISLSRREADIAITLERPEPGPHVCSRLCDYNLNSTQRPAISAHPRRSRPA